MAPFPISLKCEVIAGVERAWPTCPLVPGGAQGVPASSFAPHRVKLPCHLVTLFTVFIEVAVAGDIDDARGRFRFTAEHLAGTDVARAAFLAAREVRTCHATTLAIAGWATHRNGLEPRRNRQRPGTRPIVGASLGYREFRVGRSQARQERGRKDWDQSRDARSISLNPARLVGRYPSEIVSIFTGRSFTYIAPKLRETLKRCRGTIADYLQKISPNLSFPTNAGDAATHSTDSESSSKKTAATPVASWRRGNEG